MNFEEKKNLLKEKKRDCGRLTEAKVRRKLFFSPLFFLFPLPFVPIYRYIRCKQRSSALCCHGLAVFVSVYIPEMSNCKCKAKPCVKCGNCSRCCQHATHKKNRPPLNCKCKVMRCPACDLCSSCCQHGSRRRSIVKRFKWNAARSKANKKLLFDLCMLVGVYDALKNKKVPQGKRGFISICISDIILFLSKLASLRLHNILF